MLELITSFIIGALLLSLSCILLRLELKWLFRLLINAALGGVLLVCFDLFGIVSLALNPLTALVAGFAGIFGIAAIFLITRFL